LNGIFCLANWTEKKEMMCHFNPRVKCRSEG
jgi:hypothetical protein